MLKVTLSPSANFDKLLESASKNFYSLLEEAGKGGLLRIHVYPSLDSITASSIVFMKALSSGIDPIVTLSIEPPAMIEEPSVLLGFNNLDYKVGDVISKVVAFYSGESKSIPVHGATYIEGPGSVSAITFLTVTGGKDYEPSYITAALAGSYSSGYVDKPGRFQGVDRVMLDKLRLATRLSLEMVTTVKGYKPSINDICESLSITASPYYPGFTGDYDSCTRIIQSQNIPQVLGLKLAGLDQKLLESLVQVIVNTVRRSYNIELDLGDIIGGSLISTTSLSPSVFPVLDFRESSDALVYAGEAFADPGRVIATLVDVENEYPLIESRLESYPRRMKDLLQQIKPVKLKSNIRIQVYKIELGRGDSPTLLWRALRTLKLVEQGSVIVFEYKGETLASPFQVEEALGSGGCRKLRDQGIARLEGGLLWVNMKALVG